MRIRLASDALLLFAAVVLGGGTLLLFGLFLWHGAFGLVDLRLSTGGALGFDAMLSLAFFLQHSVMLRSAVRRRLAVLVPSRYDGAVFAVVSGLVLAAVVLLWQTAGPVWLSLEGPARIALRVLLLLPLLGVIWAARAIREFDPFGTASVAAHWRGATPPATPLSVRGPYRLVRQPMYALVLVLLWAHPAWTADRLLLAVLWSAWVVLGAHLEERDLTTVYGDTYRAYRRQVPMFLPRLGGRGDTPACDMPAERTRTVVLILVSVAALLFFRHVGGALEPFARAHGANVAVSFGAFFVLGLFRLPGNRQPLVTAAYALAVVWIAEFAQWLRLYPGTFDGYDLFYDAVGVALAWGVGHLLQLTRPRSSPSR